MSGLAAFLTKKRSRMNKFVQECREYAFLRFTQDDGSRPFRASENVLRFVKGYLGKCGEVIGHWVMETFEGQASGIPFGLPFQAAEKQFPFGTCDLGNGEEDEFILAYHDGGRPSVGLKDYVSLEGPRL